MHLCRFAGNLQSMRMTLGVDERGVLTTLYTQFLDIDLTSLNLRLDAEAIALYQQMAVLKDHRISTIDKILGGLAKTAAGIDIAADGAGTLLSKQRLEISMLTNQFVAVLGGIGAHTSSQISTPNFTPLLVTKSLGSALTVRLLPAKKKAVGFRSWAEANQRFS